MPTDPAHTEPFDEDTVDDMLDPIDEESAALTETTDDAPAALHDADDTPGDDLAGDPVDGDVDLDAILATLDDAEGGDDA